MKLSIQEILEATHGKLLQGKEVLLTSLSTDSRTLLKGDFFLCLQGETFDGHHYISEVLAKGAAGIILQNNYFNPELFKDFEIPVIAVEDTLHALGNMARAWRRKFSIPMIAIGGSNGKTTTKDMTAFVLASQYKTLATEGNLNNLIGVPKMLLKLDENHEAAVIEMGMNDFGEMARLTEIVEPTVGLLTNTGYEHVEKMKNLEGVAKSNAEMFEKLASGTLALVNADDDYIPKMQTKAYKISYGMEKTADIFCEKCELKDDGISLLVFFRGKRHSFDIPVYGKANSRNALAAIAVGLCLGIDAEKMRKNLIAYQGRTMRMELLKLKQGIQILNDCYNANPSSMQAALETLSFLKKSHPGLAILGEMKELGDFAEKGHRLVGESVARNGITRLISIGPFAKQMVESAVAAGMQGQACLAVSTQEEAFDKMLSWSPECKSILVKGSRGARMEKVTEKLKEVFS